MAQEGVERPKPLVELNGEPMIQRLIRIFNDNGAEEVVIIANTLHPQTGQFIKDLQKKGTFGNIRLILKSTPSSMHSFYELSSYLKDAPFCLTTVDTIFDEREFAAYVRRFQESRLDGMMAVTDYVDDEKPLYVATDEAMRITGFHDANEGDRYISGGIYCLRPRTLSTLERCMREGQSRMRNFQRGLVADGFRLEACVFSKILDVDHAGDIAKAEAFLSVGK